MTSVLDEHVHAARRHLDREVFDYYSAGSGDELSVREAEAAWRSFRFRPRVLRDVSDVDLSTDLLGSTTGAPFLVAPMAFHGLAHPEGECATVAGVAEAGCLAVISTRASRTLEDIAAAAAGPWWFQAYAMKDRGLTESLVIRAPEAGARAIVLTVDTPYVARKRTVGAGRIAIPDDHFLINLARHLPPGRDARQDAEQDPSVTEEFIARLAEVSGLPVVVKGVLRGDEAVRCVEAGAAAVIVSTHGGRQLDRAIPSAFALPEVIEAIGGRVPVLVDGGVRSGSDALVALAMGATAVLVGRPALWALAAGGASGVAAMLTELVADLRQVMAIAGAASAADLDPSMVVGWSGFRPSSRFA